MFPMPNMLSQYDFTLTVPGQDSPKTFIGNNYHPFTAYIEVRFNATNGDFEQRVNLGTWTAFSPATMWIDASVKDPDLFDPTQYQVRFINVTGDTAKLSGDTYWAGGGYGAEDAWINLESHTYWRLTNNDGDWDFYQVQGLISIRKEGDPTSTRVGNMTLYSFRDGPS